MAHILKKSALAATLVAVGVAAACSTTIDPTEAASRSGRQCFNVSEINGYSSVDTDTVRVEAGTRNIWELEIVGTCPEIDWSNRIALRSRGGSSWVCEGLDAELLVPAPTGLQRCPVIGVRKLSPAEVDAVKAKRK